MSLIKNLEKIIEESHEIIEDIKNQSMLLTEINDCESGNLSENIICHGDNLKFMKSLLTEKNMAGKLQLIYIDPPFFSKANYDATIKLGSSAIKHPAYEDRWNRDMTLYLKMITCRLILMKELLKDNGLIWLHLDWHSVHYAKIIMDELFGEDNFVNEIIWNYKSGGSTSKHFARKHDTILVYSKTGDYQFFPLKEKSYNRGLKPYRFKEVEEFQDNLGWYTMVNMKDVWNIDMVGRTSFERTGYATQKPEQLLNRIICSSTKEGDICADFFSGSGTLAVAAAKLNRRFIAADESQLAIENVAVRLHRINESFQLYSVGKKIKNGLDVSFQIALEDDKAKITINKVKERGLNNLFDVKDIDKIKKEIKKDSINLLSHWSVDFSYDGKVHRPDGYAILSKEGIDKVVWGNYTIGDTINIKFVDVFGNISFERVLYEEIIEK